MYVLSVYKVGKLVYRSSSPKRWNVNTKQSTTVLWLAISKRRWLHRRRLHFWYNSIGMILNWSHSSHGKTAADRTHCVVIYLSTVYYIQSGRRGANLPHPSMVQIETINGWATKKNTAEIRLYDITHDNPLHKNYEEMKREKKMEKRRVWLVVHRRHSIPLTTSPS